MRYSISIETKTPLFEGDISSLDINKVRFLYWLSFYHAINQMEDHERPKKEIIENDVLLDEFMRLYIAKRKKETRRLFSSAKGNKTETIVFES